MPTLPTKPWYQVLYIQVLIAVAVGISIGWRWPDIGISMRPLGDGFIKLVKMIISPIIFCTVVHGVASMSDIRKLGRVGAKTLLYFEIISTLALVIGLVVVNLLQPGAGFNMNPATLDADAVAASRDAARQAHSLAIVPFLLGIIPTSFFDAFAKGDVLQVLLLAMLTAFALLTLGDRALPVLRAIESGSQLSFGILGLIVRLAPIGALGAMAFTVGRYGLGSLNLLLKLMGGFYLTSVAFVIVVLGLVAQLAGFSIFRLLGFIKEEILLVLGTSSSETALPGIMRKLQRLGCAPSTVNFVVPTGYSFNLDGTSIYMAMGAIFLAQATNTPMDLRHQITLLLVAMLSSKGASGVTGAGFIALAATLAVFPTVPMESLALLVGIDRFMSECRAITNLIGNSVATIVISRWEGEVSPAVLSANLEDMGGRMEGK